MNFIKYKDQSLVNLDLIVQITTVDLISLNFVDIYRINFWVGSENNFDWAFHDKGERDKVYNNIIENYVDEIEVGNE